MQTKQPHFLQHKNNQIRRAIAQQYSEEVITWYYAYKHTWKMQKKDFPVFAGWPWPWQTLTLKRPRYTKGHHHIPTPAENTPISNPTKKTTKDLPEGWVDTGMSKTSGLKDSEHPGKLAKCNGSEATRGRKKTRPYWEWMLEALRIPPYAARAEDARKRSLTHRINTHAQNRPRNKLDFKKGKRGCEDRTTTTPRGFNAQYVK